LTTHRLTRTAAEAPSAPRSRRRAWALAALAACAGAGCGLPPNPREVQLLTLADLETLADNAGLETTFADDDSVDGVPGGLRLRDYITKDAAGYHLTLRNTWTEAYRSAYVTTEIWTGFDEVWVQPVYVPVTGFANGAPTLLADPSDPTPGTDPANPGAGGWNPIFSVGPDSAFYSPFWRVFYFQVAAGTSPNAYKSARDVIDSGLPLVEGPPRTMSLIPKAAVTLPTTVMGSPQLIGGPVGVSRGYLDGNQVSFLDFGKDTFSSNGELVVEETPLFMLLTRDAGGNLQRMNVPTVAGTGPLYANRPPAVSGFVPHYGAYWRLYTVEVPATARIFAPPTVFPTESADYPPALVAQTYGADVLKAGPADIGQWLGRVALNALPAADGSDSGCFDEYNDLDTNGGGNPPEPCQWLDSQPALERAVPSSSIKKTDILITCPFVSYADQPFVVTP
jgi:hypothetical protein